MEGKAGNRASCGQRETPTGLMTGHQRKGGHCGPPLHFVQLDTPMRPCLPSRVGTRHGLKNGKGARSGCAGPAGGAGCSVQPPLLPAGPCPHGPPIFLASPCPHGTPPPRSPELATGPRGREERGP